MQATYPSISEPIWWLEPHGQVEAVWNHKRKTGAALEVVTQVERNFSQANEVYPS